MYAMTGTSIATLRVGSGATASAPVLRRLWHSAALRWLRHDEYRLSQAIERMDHPGVLADYQAAQRQGSRR